MLLTEKCQRQGIEYVRTLDGEGVPRLWHKAKLRRGDVAGHLSRIPGGGQEVFLAIALAG